MGKVILDHGNETPDKNTRAVACRLQVSQKNRLESFTIGLLVDAISETVLTFSIENHSLRRPNTPQQTLSPIDFKIHLDSLTLTEIYQDSYQQACKCRSNAAFKWSIPASTVLLLIFEGALLNGAIC
ncbi:hypothetical protein TNCV_189471 [Trichonephila clavipes]|nr:hypothetical protein TNCV_189471 [Trichonephila clavipes]